MLETSATRQRFYVEDGKMKCGLAGRTRGKRCGSTLMIDGSIVCSAGHKFTLDELVAATVDSKPRSLIVQAILAAANCEYKKGAEIAGILWQEKFSPPYSMPATKASVPQQDEVYHWMDHDPWEFDMLLQMADWWNPKYAEALRQVWVERSGQTEIVAKALRKLNEEAKSGNFHSQMMRDHLIDCSERSRFAFTVGKMATRYYMLTEALKVTGDTNLLWLYEDSLNELSMMRWEPKWNPLVFNHYDDVARRMEFKLCLRRPDFDPEAVDGRVFVRLRNSGHVSFQAYSGAAWGGQKVPSGEEVERIIERTILQMPDEKGAFLEISGGHIRPKEQSSTDEERWQLKAVADLRQWLCRLTIEPVTK